MTVRDTGILSQSTVTSVVCMNDQSIIRGVNMTMTEKLLRDYITQLEEYLLWLHSEGIINLDETEFSNLGEEVLI